MNGSVIPDEDITFGKVTASWTLGRYLNKIHTSAEKLNIGIASKDTSQISQVMAIIIVL
jgi:hypothetical protein